MEEAGPSDPQAIWRAQYQAREGLAHTTAKHPRDTLVTVL